MSGVLPRLVKVEDGLWVDPDEVMLLLAVDEVGNMEGPGTLVWLKHGHAYQRTTKPADAVAAIINAHREKRLGPQLNLFKQDNGKPKGRPEPQEEPE